MVAIKVTKQVMASLQAKHRRVLSAKIRSDLFHQTKRLVVHKLTPEEKKGRATRRKSRKEVVDTKMAEAMRKVREAAEQLAKDLGGETAHWHRKLMQNARIGVTRREPNRWNAFLSKQLEELNAG